jgi:hypothetical protein
MSIVIRESHANNSQPLWVSVNNPDVDGTLTVSGGIRAPGIDFILPDDTLVGARVASSGFVDGKLYLQATEVLVGQVGQGTTNTKFTTSAPGANADVLAVGGTVNVIGNINATGTIIATGNVGAGKLILPTTGAGPTAGKAFITAGSDDVVVPTTAVTADSIILVTRMGTQALGPGIGSGQQAIMVPSAQIIPGVSFQAFLVDPSTGIVTAANTVNAEFSWVIIN